MASNELKKIKIVIVGAGFGGLGMGIALKRAGEDDFMILEKHSDIGGVWRDNTYPGCTCDVPSHLYSFSFAPYRSRDQRYPPQQAILAYLQQVASDYGLRPHLCLNTEISEAHFQQDKNNWNIVTKSNQQDKNNCNIVTESNRHICAEVVIFAVGQLHKPNSPDIPGVENFPGSVFHSAEWDHKIDRKNKRISVIGTGSSAAQMLPTLARESSHLTVFQRTPQWVLPKPDSNFGCIGRSILQIPGAHRLYRRALGYGADIVLSPVMRSVVWRRIVESYAKYNLRRQIPNKELVKKLMPLYPIGSKRILFDNQFYHTLTFQNVTLVTEPIRSISKGGIETSGKSTKTDIIIFATGFRASDFLVPMSVRGRDGYSLNKDWNSGAEAFLGLAIHGYPNLFMIAGPNTFNPAGSNPEMKELQIAYIMECLRWKKEISAQAIEVNQQATTQYQEWLTRKMGQTVWPDSVNSWYKHESGKVTNPWPVSVRVFARMLRNKPQHSFVSVYTRAS
jgi:cation diffusion facilitator CzcD-associated flavoprotein CzcO